MRGQMLTPKAVELIGLHRYDHQARAIGLNVRGDLPEGAQYTPLVIMQPVSRIAAGHLHQSKSPDFGRGFFIPIEFDVFARTAD